MNYNRLTIYVLIYLMAVCMPLVNVYGEDIPWKKITEEELAKNLHRLSPNSLNRYSKSVYSQFGDEGIIDEIFRRIGVSHGFFVEFGASDGVFLSITRLLWENGWRGVMIEADRDLFRKLHAEYENEPRVLTLNAFITWEINDERGVLFEQLRREYFPQNEIDFLSIDIDGGDFYVLKSLKCRPKVICIEGGLSWHPLMKEEVPAKIALDNLQQPFKVTMGYAEKMGYRAVCATNNLFLVRSDYAHLFDEIPNDSVQLWRDALEQSLVRNISLRLEKELMLNFGV